jgi:hypothetical protein
VLDRLFAVEEGVPERAARNREQAKRAIMTIFLGHSPAGDTRGNAPGSDWCATNAIAEFADLGRRYTKQSNQVQRSFEDTQPVQRGLELLVAAGADQSTTRQKPDVQRRRPSSPLPPAGGGTKPMEIDYAEARCAARSGPAARAYRASSRARRSGSGVLARRVEARTTAIAVSRSVRQPEWTTTGRAPGRVRNRRATSTPRSDTGLVAPNSAPGSRPSARSGRSVTPMLGRSSTGAEWRASPAPRGWSLHGGVGEQHLRGLTGRCRRVGWAGYLWAKGNS